MFSVQNSTTLPLSEKILHLGMAPHHILDLRASLGTSPWLPEDKKEPEPDVTESSKGSSWSPPRATQRNSPPVSPGLSRAREWPGLDLTESEGDDFDLTY